MNILQLYSGQDLSSGDFYYRIQQPALHLSRLDDIRIVNVDLLYLAEPSLLLHAHLLILHHICDPDLLSLVARRKELGLPTVYELADNFRASIDHKSPRSGTPDYYSAIEELMRRCDAVQTSNENLREQYKDLNANFFVFVNLIDEIKKRDVLPRPDTVTVGWGGSARHLDDVKAYAPIIVEWVQKHPSVRFAVMGSKQIRQLFDKLAWTQLLSFAPGSLDQYLTFLDHLDIGLAPLLSTAFNAGRSDIKFVEYASREVVPLCSRFGPYLGLGREGEEVLYFGGPTELIERLDYLLADRHERQRLARNARAWAERNRLSVEPLWRPRADLYAGLAEPAKPDLSAFEQKLDGLNLNAGDALTEGLAAGDSDKGLEILADTSHSNPNNYQALYFYGWALAKSGNYAKAAEILRKALDLYPISIRAAELLARIDILQGEIGEARRIIETALQSEPSLDSLVKLRLTINKLAGHEH